MYDCMSLLAQTADIQLSSQRKQFHYVTADCASAHQTAQQKAGALSLRLLAVTNGAAANR